MPITTAASYLPATEAFLTHWADVNSALGSSGPLAIPGATVGETAAVPVATLEALYDALVEQHSTVQGAVTAVSLERGEVETQKTAAIDKLGQFNDKVRGNHAGSKWERALPLVPSQGDARQKIVDPLDAASGLWERLNATGSTLTLRDGFALASFDTMIAALRTAYRTLAAAEQGLKLEREERNDLQEKIYPVLKQYRVLMPTFFAESHALVASLPRLTPEGGHTPAAVTAQGTWDAASGQGKITWSASSDSDLAGYSVRWSPGGEYSTEDESVVATVGPGAPREFFTLQGLGTPGATSLFRVYVVLNSDNERGSETVSVLRPV